jgi:hypothetical protein
VQFLDHARDQSRQKVVSLARLIEGDERTRERVAGEFREATEQLTRLKEYEQQEQELGKVQAELKRLSGIDPAVLVAKAREECDALSAVAQAVPTLARLLTLRDELRKGREQEQAVEKARQAVQARGEKLAAELRYRAATETVSGAAAGRRGGGCCRTAAGGRREPGVARQTWRRPPLPPLRSETDPGHLQEERKRRRGP